MSADPSRPLLSVLVPVRDGERHLAETIESVLRQDWRPLEMLVIDDGSTDGSAAIAEGFGPPVRCFRRAPAGVAAARNAAVAEARGAFLLHLDADDLLPAGSIALRMSAFEADADLELVAGHLEVFFSPEMDTRARARLRLPEGPQRGHISGVSIVRAEAFRRVGVLDESLRVGADIDWFARATETGLRIRVLDDVVLLRRIHGRNMSLTLREERVDRLRVLKAALDRRRSTTKRA